MMELIYYPGCSLKTGLAQNYDKSVRVVAEALGVELHELDGGGSCCGANEAFSIGEDVSLYLAACILATAERTGLKEMTVPCSGCYMALVRTNALFAEDPSKLEKINGLLTDGLKYSGGMVVEHLIETLHNRVGADKVKEKVKKPLTGLKLATSYGCMYLRPSIYTHSGENGKDNPENPLFMDELLGAAGAEVLGIDKFPAKTDCCGGTFALANETLSYRMCSEILLTAKEAGADMLALGCPLCGAALDLRQPAIAKQYGERVSLPVVYFTQLLGFAFGYSVDELGLKFNVSSPKLIRKEE